jgi:hypothetical protein
MQSNVENACVSEEWQCVSLPTNVSTFKVHHNTVNSFVNWKWQRSLIEMSFCSIFFHPVLDPKFPCDTWHVETELALSNSRTMLMFVKHAAALTLPLPFNPTWDVMHNFIFSLFFKPQQNCTDRGWNLSHIAHGTNAWEGKMMVKNKGPMIKHTYVFRTNLFKFHIVIGGSHFFVIPYIQVTNIFVPNFCNNDFFMHIFKDNFTFVMNTIFILKN